jgi:hypothetical protein
MAIVWVGGHLILSISVLPKALRAGNIKMISEFENSFEKIGIPALLIQVITGLALMHRHFALPFSLQHRGDLLIAIKSGLLLLTILLALHARLRLIPKLSKKTLPLLGLHILAVTSVGILFVIVGLSFRTNLFF